MNPEPPGYLIPTKPMEIYSAKNRGLFKIHLNNFSIQLECFIFDKSYDPFHLPNIFKQIIHIQSHEKNSPVILILHFDLPN